MKNSLPKNWRWVKLGEVCEVNPPRQKGFARKTDALTTFIPMEAVDEENGVIANPQKVPYSNVSKGYTYFEENDVLFAKITPCMQNGKHVIARNLINGIGFGTTEFHVLRSKGEVLPEWIWYFIRQPYFLEEAAYYFTGAVGQQRVPDEFLADYDIPLPPIQDQRRIAQKIQELMQEIEQAKKACEKQLEASQALPSAYLREVFESPKAKKGERKRLGEVCGIIKGKKPELYNVKDKGFLPYLTAETLRYNVPPQWCNPNDKNAVEVNENEIILIADGSYSGDVFLGFRGVLASTMGKLKVNNAIVADYLFWFIRYNFYILNSTKRGGAIPHLEKDIFYKLETPLPSLFIQQSIVAELKEKMAEAEKLQSTIRNQQSALSTLPQAILRKAFRGEL